MVISRHGSTISSALAALIAACLSAGCDAPTALEQQEPAEPITQPLTASLAAGNNTPTATTSPVGSTNPMDAVVSSPVVDPVKCPERLHGNGTGNLVGSMCIYPMPPGGDCTELGSDCNPTQDTPKKCRCPKKGFEAGPGGGALEVLPAS
jgi:hypothetical protein